MRENCTYGSEGGECGSSSLPYHNQQGTPGRCTKHRLIKPNFAPQFPRIPVFIGFSGDFLFDLYPCILIYLP